MGDNSLILASAARLMIQDWHSSMGESFRLAMCSHDGAELPFTTIHISAATGPVAGSIVETWRDGQPTAVGMAMGAIPVWFAASRCSSRFQRGSMIRSTPLRSMVFAARSARF